MFLNQRAQPNWFLLYSSLLALAIWLSNLSFMLFIHDEYWKIILFHLPYPLWSLLAALALFYAAKRSASVSRRLMLAWGLLATGRFVLFCGEITVVILAIRLGAPPFPSLADGLFLAYYPLFLIGILLLPAPHLNLRTWAKTGLDITIVLLSSGLVLWQYWLGPLAMQISDERPLVQLLSLAYPVGNLVLLWALLMLLYRPSTGEARGPLLLLAVGVAIQIVISCFYGRQSISATSISADWLSIGWIFTSLIFVIAALWQATRGQPATRPAGVRNEEEPPTQLNTWVTYLPYASAIGAYFTLEASHSSHPGPSWLAWTVGLIIGLVLFRQMITLRENSLLYTQVHNKGLALSQTNQELRDTQAMLIHAEKMNALGQMVAGIAHEINNPVAFVNSNIHTLKQTVTKMMTAYTALERLALATANTEAAATVAAFRKKADIDFLEEDLDDLVNSSLNGLTRVRKIVDGLRNFSRLDEAEYQMADLREGIESSLLIAQPILKKRIQVKLDLEQLPLLYCRPAELNQVFLNLILNAAHAIGEQGTITITGHNVADEVILTFADTGCGMSAEVMKQIFNPFFTTKPVGVGTGLGLTIAYKIITAGHGGTIDVASSPGSGTTFTIRLPKENSR